MRQDLHNNVEVAVALVSQAIATDTTTVGAIIDTAGFESIEFAILSKAITDGTYTAKLEDGDDSGLSDAEVVSSELVLGALPDFVAADDNTVFRVGSISKKRYQRLSIVSATTTTGVDIISAIAVLGNPHTAPTAAQST